MVAIACDGMFLQFDLTKIDQHKHAESEDCCHDLTAVVVMTLLPTSELIKNQ